MGSFPLNCWLDECNLRDLTNSIDIAATFGCLIELEGVEDNTHSRHRIQKTQAGTDLEASSLRLSLIVSEAAMQAAKIEKQSIVLPMCKLCASQ